MRGNVGLRFLPRHQIVTSVGGGRVQLRMGDWFIVWLSTHYQKQMNACRPQVCMIQELLQTACITVKVKGLYTCYSINYLSHLQRFAVSEVAAWLARANSSTAHCVYTSRVLCLVYRLHCILLHLQSECGTVELCLVQVADREAGAVCMTWT